MGRERIGEGKGEEEEAPVEDRDGETHLDGRQTSW